MKNSHVILAHKQDSIANLRNYIRITLISPIFKVVDKIMTMKLSDLTLLTGIKDQHLANLINFNDFISNTLNSHPDAPEAYLDFSKIRSNHICLIFLCTEGGHLGPIMFIFFFYKWHIRIIKSLFHSFICRWHQNCQSSNGWASAEESGISMGLEGVTMLLFSNVNWAGFEHQFVDYFEACLR